MKLILKQFIIKYGRIINKNSCKKWILQTTKCFNSRRHGFVRTVATPTLKF